MYLKEIDVIGLEPLQAARYRIHDVPARCTHVVRTAAGPAIALGGDDDVGALDADVLQRLTGESLRIPGGIDVRRVEKIDACFQRARDEPGRAFQIEFADD